MADSSPLTIMVGAAIGLLVFSFGMAGSRFEMRKALVIAEANEIRSAYLRTDLLDASEMHAIRSLLREYADIRINKAGASGTPDEHNREALARTAQVQAQLWATAVKVSLKVSDYGNDLVDADVRSRAASPTKHCR